MECLWPQPARPVTDADLEVLYGYPEDLESPWVQVNFVASADGAVSVEGHSAGLSHPADKQIYVLGRDLADVILVGAGTAKAETYRGARKTAQRTNRRGRLGLAEVPPIAVVSARATITPADPVITDTHVPTLVFTTEAAPPERKRDLETAGADVLVTGEHEVDIDAALKALDDRGLRRVNCEGGPQLFAALIAADRVDQLCLTIAPLLAGGGAGRIATGSPSGVPRGLHLASLLHEDGFLMARYRRSA